MAFQYHRNNGITKIGLVSQQDDKDDELDLEWQSDSGKTAYIMRPTEGAMQLIDRMNNAYLRTHFNDTYIVSGQQFMPFKPAVRNEAEKILNAIGNLAYPVLLALGLPVYLYGLVLEKEKRLIQTMRINGLKMSNYWLVNFVFSLLQYCVVMTVFYCSGYYLSGLTFFTDTDPIIVLSIFFGWGLNQVSQAFFLSCFLNDSQTASMIGYSFSIILTIIGSTICITGIACGTHGDYVLKDQYYIHPAFTYAHAMFYLSNECAWEKCIDHI